MLYIETKSTDASYNFALEEFFMSFVLEEKIFILWQTDNCVMLGSNQNPQTDINFDEIKKSDVQVVRRSSGGGTIYTDQGTILCSLIIPYNNGEDVKKIAEEQLLHPLIKILSKFGVQAKIQGRNDILVHEKKISGLAQRTTNKKLCSHCSLLYDSDLSMLENLLIVDEEKLKSKGIRSVRDRVANIREFSSDNYTTKKFIRELKKKLFKELPMVEYHISNEEDKKIQIIRNEKYDNPTWTYKLRPNFTFHNQKRFPAGKVEVYMEIENGKITGCAIYGDFLALRPIKELEDSFVGELYQLQDINKVLKSTNLSLFLVGISSDEFLSVILK